MQEDFALAAFDYDLPEQRIAQFPTDRREQSRLLVLERGSGRRHHLLFADIVGFIRPGDLLVVNNTKVFPARLQGKKESGGKAELFLLNYPEPDPAGGPPSSTRSFTCEALIKSSRRPSLGSRIMVNERCSCLILTDLERGKWRVRLDVDSSLSLADLLNASGQVPLPPYIKRPDGPSPGDAARYQTVYAERPGAVAAPTAGLHFSVELLDLLRERGVGLASITLHVGYGTFAPVESEDIRSHAIHREYVEVPESTAQMIRATKAAGNAVWAIGTTTVRTLEFAGRGNGGVEPLAGWCDLYITPGFTFRVVDRLVTNFHLPRSSLLFLVAALCGREVLLSCYREAIGSGYRFYSYGDAMAII
ncbi:tRNA preQ1(34) S-adenosylmethionine ribosyltransferase-isomerase QueA [Desulfofustis limnaeus]|uniref:S-adenosylmethionine:tRNA ribosyltransferase-isomerase n=1 Tax=Desulfofustis limnaeus TaxID=2740163 RepID=A0ABN6M0M1_9BACT|nr:tRNA preQ1(34) S-adenosylmethionine ribosyltransferase-isomerase QueA [Desulfofustis limnaeus]MDX9895298.1 tRNA preQ1(34) S-adenosylmethionine ribosyltransferase-isomerase QueA [Desulfofustis sp.]BDD86433.1 S-adenosylmethionine:tRNA ribosyltransferase-isomerase [Desulfofustis limnaeus]